MEPVLIEWDWRMQDRIGTERLQTLDTLIHGGLDCARSGVKFRVTGSRRPLQLFVSAPFGNRTAHKHVPREEI